MSSSAGNVLPLLQDRVDERLDRDNLQIHNTLAASGHILYLSSLLQSSLDVEDVLTRFREEIIAHVPVDALHYSLPASKRNNALHYATRENPYRHRLSYQLSVNQEALGMLQVSRKRKFTDSEIRQLEDLICALLYPLRNALLYRSAIGAAHKDALTGVRNRAAFDEVLSRETEIAQRHGRSLGLIVMDIDHFKMINDNYGHAAGDCLLKKLAHSAENTIRLSDQLFRYGGEEFVVLAPETSINGVRQLAERIRRNLESVECVCDGQAITLTASFGVALLREDESETGFFSRADKALYQAKADGRNCTRVAP